MVMTSVYLLIANGTFSHSKKWQCYMHINDLIFCYAIFEITFVINDRLQQYTFNMFSLECLNVEMF